MVIESIHIFKPFIQTYTPQIVENDTFSRKIRGKAPAKTLVEIQLPGYFEL